MAIETSYQVRGPIKQNGKSRAVSKGVWNVKSMSTYSPLCTVQQEQTASYLRPLEILTCQAFQAYHDIRHFLAYLTM